MLQKPKVVWVNTGLAVLLVGTGTLTATVTGTGNVASASQDGVNFAGSGGTLVAVYVRSGQEVTAGQRLARIDLRRAAGAGQRVRLPGIRSREQARWLLPGGRLRSGGIRCPHRNSRGRDAGRGRHRGLDR